MMIDGFALFLLSTGYMESWIDRIPESEFCSRVVMIHR